MITNVQRREFLELTALGLAALFVPGLTKAMPAWAVSAASPGPQCGSQLAPIFVHRATASLIGRTEGVKPVVAGAFSVNLYDRAPANIGFSAVQWSACDEYFSTHLTTIDGKTTDDSTLTILALGHLVAGCWKEYADKLYESLTADEQGEASLYHDAALVRLFFKWEPSKKDLNAVSVFFKSLLPVMIARTHTLKPDPEDGAQWIVYLSRWHRAIHEYLDTLTAVVVQPDKGKWAKYVADIKFVDAGDPALQLILDENLAPEAAALNPDSNSSLIAKAICNAYARLMAV